MSEYSFDEQIDTSSETFTHEPDNDPKAKRFFSPEFKLPRTLLLSFLGLGCIAVIAFILIVTSELPPLQAIENPQSDQSTQLISADGVVLQKLYSRENRVNLSLDEISPFVIDALIATEDVRFFEHPGIDPKSFFSILAGYVRSGRTRGGSTITMQLARNLYDVVGKERTAIRKLKEFFVSTYIERFFTKEEILTAYLNTVNIYGESYGIETAANRLFDKPAKDLTIEEAALIVGMLKGQGVYNPFRHTERTELRRNTVIEQMVKYDKIDPTVINVDSIKAIPLAETLAKQGAEHVRGIAPYFREHLRRQLQDMVVDLKKADGSPYNIYTDGLRVHTTLDSRMQKHAEAAVKEHLTALQKDFDRLIKGREPYKENPEILNQWMKASRRYQVAKKAGKSDREILTEFREKIDMTIFTWKGEKEIRMSPLDSLKHHAQFLETGMASIDPRTGHVKAWVGGIDYKKFKYDHVAKGRRQVGSTFKPFVYAAAIEKGRKPCDEILNQYVYFETADGKKWQPQNSGGAIGGLIPIKRGLATSANLITATLMKEVGPPAVADMAYKAGIHSTLDEVPSLCLGTTDLSVLEMAEAYSTFANNGIHTTPLFVTRIEDQFGNVLKEFIPKAEERIKPETAYTMVRMLQGPVDQPGGTAHRLRFRYNFQNEIAGKTGTTQNQSDGWFMGFTPSLVTGVWVGCADRRMRFKSIKYGQGANMALPIWALYMKRVLADEDIGMTPERFIAPEDYAVNFNCSPPEEAPTEIQPDGIDFN